MKPTRRIILARLVKHEFVRATRALSKDLTRVDALKALLEQQEKSFERLGKLAGTAILGLFWLRSHIDAAEIKFSFVNQEFSAPASYLLFVLGFCYFGLMMELVNYTYLDVFIGVLAKKNFGLDSKTGLNALYNARSLWSTIANLQYRFLKSGTAHALVGLATAIFLMLPLLIIFLYFAFEILRLAVISWAYLGPSYFEKAVLAVTIAFTLFPWVLIGLSIFPFTFSKNYNFIRWLFLFRLSRSAGEKSPSIERWLADPRK